MGGEESIDYSMVICSYNPDENVLKRCLQAVLQLDIKNITTEVILVDNNSTTPLHTLSYIQEYQAQIPAMKQLLATRQGLTYARMAAIEAARGKYIVYFDDDNEPESDYLQELHRLTQQYPQVAAWGPGKVQVDFVNGIENDIKQLALVAFQYREETQVKFAAEKEWQPCYPYGTGLCIKTALLREYVQQVQQGHLTLSGRKGKKLSSGEDTQMIMLCIRKGYSAGVSPALKLTHIITQKRANRQYLKRLVYGTLVCYETCLLQVFPERKELVERKLISSSKYSRRTVKGFLKTMWSNNLDKKFDLIQFIAFNAGVYTALDKPIPPMVNRVIKYLKLD